MRLRNSYRTILVLVSTIILTSLLSATAAAAQTPTVIPAPQIKKSLSDQIGFSDQTINELQQKGFDTLDSSLAFNAYNHSYKLFSIVGRIPPNPMPADGKVVLYQMDSSTPHFLWQWDTGSSEVLFTDEQAEISNWPVPGDWLQNGSFLFGIYTIRFSTSWTYALLHVFEFHQNQTILSILKDNIPLGHTVTSVKIEDQGRLLFSLNDIRGEGSMGISNCCGPRMRRFFEYDGLHMVDVSAKHIEEYNETLGTNLYFLTTWKVENITGQEENLFASSLLQILMIYDIAGQRQEGWTLVQSLVAQAKASGRLAEDTYVDTTFMPAMRRLFDENKPFIEPDYIGKNAPPIPNYYAND